MLFQELARASRQVGETRSRRQKVEILAGALRGLAGEEVRPGAAYLSGAVPQGKLGVGWATLSRLAAAGGEAEVATLEIREVDRALVEVAAAAGAGSAAARTAVLGRVLARTTREERDFLLRLLGGELRQGALEGVMVEAVARAAGVEVALVRRAQMASGDLAEVAAAALGGGAERLAEFSIRLFRPVLPMLAQPADDPADALERLGEAELEIKLDGARVQVHKGGGEVRVFSRGLNDVSAAVPELVEVARALPARELILDGEVIALAGDGRPHAFQATMRRFGRKLDVAALRAELPLSSWYFDLLWLDGTELVAQPLGQRMAALEGVLPAALVVPHLVTAERATAEAFFERALADGHEGMMAKALGAPYDAGGRGGAWLKIKRAQTYDLVVLAVEWGSGRRRGWLSNLHLGARDPVTGGFVMVGKTFKGMTDEMLRWQTERFLALEVAREGHIVHVRPEQVVEIALSDVQTSPHYPGGIALRFARVKRYRPDKTPADADTLDTLRARLPDSALSPSP